MVVTTVGKKIVDTLTCTTLLFILILATGNIEWGVGSFQ